MRLRLRADVPVACYLSGGLDSCAILGLAARHHPEPIRAFTLTFDRSEYDEEKEAKEMAQKVATLESISRCGRSCWWPLPRCSA